MMTVGVKNLEMTKKDPSGEGSSSGGPGSNRQPLAWKAKALPLSYRRNTLKCIKKAPFYKGVLEKILDIF